MRVQARQGNGVEKLWNTEVFIMSSTVIQRKKAFFKNIWNCFPSLPSFFVQVYICLQTTENQTRDLDEVYPHLKISHAGCFKVREWDLSPAPHLLSFHLLAWPLISLPPPCSASKNTLQTVGLNCISAKCLDFWQKSISDNSKYSSSSGFLAGTGRMLEVRGGRKHGQGMFFWPAFILIFSGLWHSSQRVSDGRN